MAISDNTSYELTGAQVKDLASKVKDNTALAKNLAGGPVKISNLIRMVRLTPEEGNSIAAQIDDPDVYGAIVATTVEYGFLDVASGTWLDRIGVGTAIDEGCDFIYARDGGLETGSYPSIVKMQAGWDDEEEDCYPVFYLRVNDVKNTFNGSSFKKITLGPNSNTGLGDWYTVSTSTWSYEADYIIQPMTSIEAQEIANKINASQQSYYLSASQVLNAMQYSIRSATTGEILNSYSGARNALIRSGAKTIFLPNTTTNKELKTMLYAGSGISRSPHFVLEDPLNGSSVSIMLKNPSSYGDVRSVMWYVFEADSSTESRNVYGYYDNTEWDPSTNTPEDMYQVTYDSSDNLYMSASNTSASDWKQINNDAITAFTGTDGTAAGSAGLVPAPATTDAGKFLKADGTWSTAGGGTSWAGEKVFYGTCSTSAASATKVVTSSADFVAEEGTVLFVKFSNGNTSSNANLNVNSLGAVAVYANGGSSSAVYGLWKAGDVVCFVHNGTYWYVPNSDRADSTQYGLTRLYTGMGTYTAGAMTQAAVTSLLNPTTAETEAGMFNGYTMYQKNFQITSSSWVALSGFPTNNGVKFSLPSGVYPIRAEGFIRDPYNSYIQLLGKVSNNNDALFFQMVSSSWEVWYHPGNIPRDNYTGYITVWYLRDNPF